MDIAGLQKMTLLDYPGQVACTVFLPGCNFRCPFCHNSQLLDGKEEPVMDHTQLLAFLKSRKGLLDGVCITGGEPTLQKDLPELLRSIRALGFKIKLDTNGYKPHILQQLLKEGLVDHVAMDIKNSPELYAATAGLKQVQLEKLEESIRLLMEGPVSYELRTTVAEQLHTEESIQKMGRWLAGIIPGKKPVKLFLQPFVDRDTVLCRTLSAPAPDKLESFVKILTPYIEKVSVRGE